MPAWWPHSDGSAAAPPRSQAIFSELCSLILLRLLDRRDVESHEPHTQNAHWSFRRSSCRWFVLLTASLVSLFNNYISFNPYNLQQIQNTIITIINSVKCVFFFMYYVWVVYWIYILLLNTTLAMKCVLRLKSLKFFKVTRNVNHQVAFLMPVFYLTFLALMDRFCRQTWNMWGDGRWLAGGAAMLEEPRSQTGRWE